jgi:hypothetical protein
MNAPIEPLYRCVCCRDSFALNPGVEPRRDPDLHGEVCPECHMRLRGAHAWLKLAGITPCTLTDKLR